ncbi:hypothetical protein C8F04DRAFT_1232611 [Mycena alexandri]|uniref:NADH:flavin oxidoreductase/NADH oxidase N-terminal domain-containing protein n=1 Tax=Mycena alexandri TaxID=1745969 RepID=A0AAD6X3D4_9AGAR|nr:hypothetical protein C8F04DRAFT_1232611 [Mycena alexandri]
MSTLFTPLELGDITIHNRMGMSACGRNRADVSTTPSEIMKEYYMQRALGGCGLIVSEATLISRQGVRDRTVCPRQPGIWNQEQIAGWKKIVDAVHTTGTKMYCQLWHVGRTSHPDAPEQITAGEPVYGPSAIAARGGEFRFLPGNPGYVTPTAIEDPTTLIALYKQAAINAKEAGFDGVEVHGANGYLIDQFLDFNSNKRTEKWGGSAENRARFGLETLKELIKVFGANVSVKLGPAGGINDVGMPLKDALETFTYFISEADKLGLSYIVLCRYVAYRDPIVDGKSRATPFDVISTFRPIIKSTKYFANVNYTPAEAAGLVAAGTVDGVFFGKLWLAHPDLAKRVRFCKPLDNIPDPKRYYDPDPLFPELGYIDYPPWANYEGDEEE